VEAEHILDRGSLRHPSRAAEQRRDVAVLFADLAGFTELVESTDPEVVYDVVRPLLDELVLLVRLHDGEVQQVLGDGFMCVFGLHGATGDEAERAVMAGLALVTAGGSRRTRPSVHVGVECGEVLVTPSWEPAGYGVWGRPVNRAKRLCDSAGPGELAIGPAAYARAGHRVRDADPVRVCLKGISGAVVSHRLPHRAALYPPLAAAGWPAPLAAAG
jgi:class 3 adenylate cyclase